MNFLRSDRLAAVYLLLAAILGILLANAFTGDFLLNLRDTHLAIPGTPIDLSIGHWVTDGVLVIFFFVAAIELKHELVYGDLNSVRKALRPTIAAFGGVAVPALVYLLVTWGSGYENGWPIPTATDIAFALGVLAVVGKGLPSRVRIFLLALAILDDIVGILIIAIFFAQSPDIALIGLAVLVIGAFGFLSRFLGSKYRVLIAIAMIILALVAWGLVLESGVHATIAGVALGAVMRHKHAMSTRHALEPMVNVFVLPIFAFAASLVLIPQVPITELAAPFWGILLALPVGKMIGIVLFGWIAMKVGGGRRASGYLNFPSLVAAGALGGIGFTVSLLMNELALNDHPLIRDEGTLAVLLGSLISAVISLFAVRYLVRYYKRLAKIRSEVMITRTGSIMVLSPEERAETGLITLEDALAEAEKRDTNK